MVKEKQLELNKMDALVNDPNVLDGSDEDEDDDDYRPSEDENAQEDANENDEDDEEEECDEQVVDNKLHDNQDSLKNTIKQTRSKANDQTNDTSSNVSNNQVLEFTEDKKKRAEQLWAELNSLSRPKKRQLILTNESNTTNDKLPKINDDLKANLQSTSVNQTKITKKYDFAGETIEIEQESINNTKSNQTNQTAKETSTKPLTTITKRTSGLGSLVSSLNKKAKMSTLVKSKLDWDLYKKDEGLEDELRNHRKNKDNFVDKQAFLQRADLKQFEQEKVIREKRRLTQSK